LRPEGKVPLVTGAPSRFGAGSARAGTVKTANVGLLLWDCFFSAPVLRAGFFQISVDQLAQSERKTGDPCCVHGSPVVNQSVIDRYCGFAATDCLLETLKRLYPAMASLSSRSSIGVDSSRTSRFSICVFQEPRYSDARGLFSRRFLRVVANPSALSARMKMPVLSSPKRTGPVSTGGLCSASRRTESRDMVRPLHADARKLQA